MRDSRADGHVRRVEIARDRVTVRRAVRGIAMTIRLNVSDFIGVVLRGDGETAMLMLEHRDPSLSVPLQDCGDDDAIARDWEAWAITLSLPRLIADANGKLHDPFASSRTAPRRRRCNVIARRRPRILMRRNPRALAASIRIHDGECEIIARN